MRCENARVGKGGSGVARKRRRRIDASAPGPRDRKRTRDGSSETHLGSAEPKRAPLFHEAASRSTWSRRSRHRDPESRPSKIIAGRCARRERDKRVPPPSGPGRRIVPQTRQRRTPPVTVNIPGFRCASAARSPRLGFVYPCLCFRLFPSLFERVLSSPRFSLAVIPPVRRPVEIEGAARVARARAADPAARATARPRRWRSWCAEIRMISRSDVGAPSHVREDTSA